jgi:protein SCO1/2
LILYLCTRNEASHTCIWSSFRVTNGAKPYLTCCPLFSVIACEDKIGIDMKWIIRKPTEMRALLSVTALLLSAGTVAAADSDMQDTMKSDDPHAQHSGMMHKQERYVKSSAAYSLPNVPVVNHNGTAENFVDLMAIESPLVLNFIFTSCTTICPVLTATFSQAQQELQAQSAPPAMISISIDPDYDTPTRLSEYAKTFHAGPNWTFLTGSTEDVLEIQKSFDVYRGDKLNHIPVTYLRLNPDSNWIRLEGFTSAGQLVQEYKDLLAANAE